jgi:hypothetical protein
MPDVYFRMPFGCEGHGPEMIGPLSAPIAFSSDAGKEGAVESVDVAAAAEAGASPPKN